MWMTSCTRSMQGGFWLVGFYGMPTHWVILCRNLFFFFFIWYNFYAYSYLNAINKYQQHQNKTICSLELSMRGGFWGFEKSWVEFCLGGRRLTFACSPRPYGRCPTCFGADGKASIERLCLSPYVEKPFNSKVIKSFVPGLKRS